MSILVFSYLRQMITDKLPVKSRRVVVIQWKQARNHPFQVFSNLKNFCASYPAYNYNTLNNYLSKDKIAFENDQVRIERKSIITKAIAAANGQQPSRIIPVVTKALLKNLNQDKEDLTYWLSRTVKERAAAVTSIVSQSLKPGQRLDKTYLIKRSLQK
ncbi:MAG: hypothetical protein ABIN89_14835 [Chitinophagaceae bacterium]